MSVKVYGASDDLVEIEGDIYEEFNPPYGEEDPSYIGLSNGVVLEITLGETWRVRPVAGANW